MCAYSWSRELMLVSPKYHAGSDGERRNVRKTEGSAVSYNCCFVFTRRRQAELSTVHYRLSCVAVPLACPSLCSLSISQILEACPGTVATMRVQGVPTACHPGERVSLHHRAGGGCGWETRHSAEHWVFIWINGFQSCQISNIN